MAFPVILATLYQLQRLITLRVNGISVMKSEYGKAV